MRNSNIIRWVWLGLLICLLDAAPAHAFYNPQQSVGGVGGLLAAGYYGSATTNCFAAYDGNGNVMALVNANDGTISANYEYGPFGEVIRMTGLMAFANPFRFSTKYQDNETDLLYYGYRFYNSSQGRWLNRDPQEEAGGMSLYGFVINNGINYFDAFGLMRIGEMEKRRKEIDSLVRLIKCCCDKSTTMSISISGKATGEQVTETVDIKMRGCTDSILILAYFWWDCGSAQGEYANDKSPNRPSGRYDWQEYGWHLGGNPQTQIETAHTGSGWWDRLWDTNDANHWNWKAAVLYIACSKGNYHAKLAVSNAEEWTWDTGSKSWGSPHDGFY